MRVRMRAKHSIGTAICVALMATGAARAAAPQRELLACVVPAAAQPCLEPAAADTVENLAVGPSAVIAGDTLVISWRGPAAEVRLLGEIQGLPALPEVGPELRRIAVRVPDANRLRLKLNFLAKSADGTRLPLQSVSVAGQDALPERVRSEGGRRLVRSFGDGRIERPVRVSLPPGYRAGHRYPVIYAADGGVHADAGLLAREVGEGGVPGFIVVGIDDCGALTGDPRCRAREYVDAPAAAGGAPEDFVRAERFLVDIVIPQIEKEFGGARERSQRAIAGASSGADWAAAMALRHPELFSTAFVMSPAQGAYRVIAARPQARFHLSAGILEQPNVRAAHCLGGAIRGAGGEATLEFLPGGHSVTMWDDIFYRQAKDWLRGAGSTAGNAAPAPSSDKDCYRFQE